MKKICGMSDRENLLKQYANRDYDRRPYPALTRDKQDESERQDYRAFTESRQGAVHAFRIFCGEQQVLGGRKSYIDNYAGINGEETPPDTFSFKTLNRNYIIQGRHLERVIEAIVNQKMKTLDQIISM